MNVIPRTHCRVWRAPGFSHQTLANLHHGLHTMESWHQTLAAEHALPWHCQACEQVVHVLRGHGECRTHNGSTLFGPHAVLTIGSAECHQIANPGGEPLEWIATMGMAPVTMHNRDGLSLPMPWDTPRTAIEYRRAVALFTPTPLHPRTARPRPGPVKTAVSTPDPTPAAARQNAA